MAGDNQMDLPIFRIDLIIEGLADYTKGNRLLQTFYDRDEQVEVFETFFELLTKIGSGYWHIMGPQNGYTAISRL